MSLVACLTVPCTKGIVFSCPLEGKVTGEGESYSTVTWSDVDLHNGLSRLTRRDPLNSGKLETEIIC